MSPSTSTRSAGKHSHAPQSGFRSFWTSTAKDPAQNGEKFIHEDPSTRAKGTKLFNFLKPQSSASTSPAESTSGGVDSRKRRQQVYQAQKRHRDRKAEYIKKLEAEVARLQHLDSIVNTERVALAQQNSAMRDLLASPAQLDAEGRITPAAVDAQVHTGQPAASVDVRFDPVVGHERTFVDDAEPGWTSAESSASLAGAAEPPAGPPAVRGDSAAAMDFILALEWPCRHHVRHPGINPDVPVPADPDAPDCHALTMTAAVYHCALAPAEQAGSAADHVHPVDHQVGQADDLPAPAEKWHLPHSEIEKLVMLSQLVEIDDESMTPAQAYAATLRSVADEAQLGPALQQLKVSLASVVRCVDFGAVLPAAEFWGRLDTVMKSF